MKSGIYKITNKINGNSYIGQSTDIKRRWKEHKHRAFNKSTSSYDSTLHKAFRKHTLDNFTFEVLDEVEISLLNEKEIYWVKFYNTYNKGYNETSGGEFGGIWYKFDEEITDKVKYYLRENIKNYEEISLELKISTGMVSEINNGKRYSLEGEIYPLRDNNHYCLDCGKKVQNRSIRCVPCRIKNDKKERLKELPSAYEIAKKVVELGFEGYGREQGMSGNAIKKWCRVHEIPHLKKELKLWFEKQ